MSERQTCWKRLRHCLKLVRNFFTCSCFHKRSNLNNENEIPRGVGDRQDNVIRLPVCTLSARMGMTAGMVPPPERWTSAPTYINVPPPPPLPTPVIMSPQQTRKRRSSPGRFDFATMDQIRGELQDSIKNTQKNDM